MVVQNLHLSQKLGRSVFRSCLLFSAGVMGFSSYTAGKTKGNAWHLLLGFAWYPKLKIGLQIMNATALLIYLNEEFSSMIFPSMPSQLNCLKQRTCWWLLDYY